MYLVYQCAQFAPDNRKPNTELVAKAQAEPLPAAPESPQAAPQPYPMPHP